MLVADSAVGWPDVALALIAALPGIIAAIAAVRVRRDIRTPSKRPLGQLMEDTTHVALANYYRLHRLNEKVPEPPRPEAPAPVFADGDAPVV